MKASKARTWLVLDCPYLCYRAFYAMGELSWKGQATGAVFGFFKLLQMLQDEFLTDRVAFCFDHRHLFRRDLFPIYKQSRTETKDEEHRQARESVHRQINDLRLRYLPKIGFANVFCQYGYESDDLMAWFAQSKREQDTVVLVTADQDLYQCLGKQVIISNGRETLTEDWFQSKYGFEPRYWAGLKALSGCHSDGVPGIPGVGELTACRYILRSLPPSYKAFKSIRSKEGRSIYRRNLSLVRLPFEDGLRLNLRLEQDRLSLAGWREVGKLLGFRSQGLLPTMTTKAHLYG